MPRVREHCCLTSCEFCFLLLQPPRGAQVWLSSSAAVAVTLSDLGCTFGAKTPCNVTPPRPGERNGPARGGLLTAKSYISALAVCRGVLALVSLHLAAETALLCGAESRVPPGSEFIALKMVPVPGLQASSMSHLNPGLPAPFSEAFLAQRNEASRSKALRVSGSQVSYQI